MAPLLIVITAPSGAGKTTLCDMLLLDSENMVYSVSCTTRPPRGDEKEGVDYTFLSEEGFLQRVADGEFLEYARVHGNLYGTLRRTVEDALRNGRDVLMDIDVQGARQVREQLARGLAQGRLVDIFIRPPSLRELERRLRARGEDDEAVIQRRLANARSELEHEAEFSHTVVNDDLRVAYGELVAYIRARKAQGGAT